MYIQFTITDIYTTCVWELLVAWSGNIWNMEVVYHFPGSITKLSFLSITILRQEVVFTCGWPDCPDLMINLHHLLQV